MIQKQILVLYIHFLASTQSWLSEWVGVGGPGSGGPKVVSTFSCTISTGGPGAFAKGGSTSGVVAAIATGRGVATVCAYDASDVGVLSPEHISISCAWLSTPCLLYTSKKISTDFKKTPNDKDDNNEEY